MHILIDTNGNYEPSSDTKKRWLYTRKKKLPFGDLLLPGLYETANFNIDRFLFIIVLLLEAYGLYVLWNILPNPLYAIIGLGADLFCAIFSHLGRKNICLAQNKKILAENGISLTPRMAPEFERDKQSQIIKNWKFYELFWYLLIAGLAFMKVLSILNYASGLVVGFKIFLTLIYISTAYIHIFHTGYFIYELWFQRWLKKEKTKVTHTQKEYYEENGIQDALIYYRLFPLNESNLYKSTKVNKQRISIDNEGERALENWGILQDDELIGLVQGQPNELKQKLAIELLTCQLDMLSKIASRTENEIINITINQ